MGDWLKKEWVKMFVNGLLSICIFLLGFWLTTKRADSQDLKNEIKSKASIESVKDVYNYVDKQDATIIAKVNDHVSADDKKDQMTIKWMESVDRKLDILITNKK